MATQIGGARAVGLNAGVEVYWAWEDVGAFANRLGSNMENDMVGETPGTAIAHWTVPDESNEGRSPPNQHMPRPVLAAIGLVAIGRLQRIAEGGGVGVPSDLACRRESAGTTKESPGSYGLSSSNLPPCFGGGVGLFVVG